MKNLSLSTILGGVLIATAGLTATAAPTLRGEAIRGKESAPLSRMRKAQPAQRWSAPETIGQRQQRVSPNFTTPTSDSFEYVYGPDGSLWYAICTYDSEDIEHEYYTEKLLKGFTVTFYDDKWNEVGQVRDNINLEEGEIRCAQMMIGSQLTKKFFNSTDDTEVMISLAMNTPEFVVHTRTLAYSINKLEDGELSTPITVLPGYPVDQVDCARDKWSEKFYITFLTEEQPEDVDAYPNYVDYLAECYQVQTTYGKDAVPVMEHKTSLLKLPGDQMSSPMMLSMKQNGKLTLAYAQYEKSFFVDPTGMGGNEALTDDNRLIIDIYQMNDSYPAEMELISTTKIETLQKTESSDVYCTYYGIGNLMWDKDVDFGNYTTDGRPAFIVSEDDYLYSDDDHYNSSYYVYDADGNRIKTIAENTYDYVMMSDLPGFEPQAMFVHMGDDMNFEMVDLYSCETVTELDHMYRGYSLSVSTDRVPSGDSYVYASALSYGLALDDDVLGAPVCWIDKEGEFIRLDVIPTGKGVQLAQIYMNADALSPYLFNTDTDQEYLLLVKRAVEGLDHMREELLIASPQKGVLHTFTEDETMGFIRSVILMGGSDPELLIVYLDNNDKFSTESYTLPFDATLQGSGTDTDPYLITTGGELQLIKNAPGAYYRLANDIDCSSVDFYPIYEFTGTLDGDGHTIANLRLVTRNNNKTGIFISTTDATIKNLNFYNAKMMLSGSYESGLLAAYATRTNFEDIHVRRLTATGDSFGGEFGGIAGKSVLSTSFNGCEIAGADINLPSCPSMGGIVGDVRTGTTATGCAVSGNLTAQSTLGGIVGSTTTGDEVFSQCHVDANLKAENTIGGIVGFLDRSKVKNNYVEGTLEATKPLKWNNSISLGGIAGELEGDWQGNADVPILQNIVGISTFKYPYLEGVEAQHPRQLTTVHRIVGRTSYNTYLEEEPDKVFPESGVVNNYVVSDIETIDAEYANNGIEGTTIDKNKVDTDWLEENVGFVFGTSFDAPWNIQTWYAYDPALYYESIAYIPTQEISVNEGDTFEIEIEILSREELTEDDIIGGFLCEYDESLLEMTGKMTYDGRVMAIEFTAIAAGKTEFNASILDGKTRCSVTVNEGNAVAGIESAAKGINYSNGIVTAEGRTITVYDLHGKLLLSGHDRVDASSLNAGVYVAVATNPEGESSSLKFAK